MNLFYSRSYQQFERDGLLWKYLQQCSDRKEESIIFVPSFNPIDQKFLTRQLDKQQLDYSSVRLFDMVAMLQSKNGETNIDELISLETIQAIELTIANLCLNQKIDSDCLADNGMILEQDSKKQEAFMTQKSLTFDQRMIERHFIKGNLVLEKVFSKNDDFFSKRVLFSNREVTLSYKLDYLYLVTIISEEQRIDYYLNERQQIIMTRDFNNKDERITDFTTMKSYEKLESIVQEIIEELFVTYDIKNFFFQKDKNQPQVRCPDVTYIEC
ncbi:hypothetical protein ACWOFR_05925 [Carnobacterium gallinarum]|uniref:hypothetical protein n=1 Tax=Carnobacterium gallinarum TaxID=2749 RepID=UPI00054D22C7|nr:hypothetical protein [Carnobacterium gallinarum]